MLEIPAVLEAWKQTTGLLWMDLARSCEVDIRTLEHWRAGRLMPWTNKAQRLAAIVGPVVGRTDLVEVIARDRAAIAKHRAAQRQLDPPKYPTPRTLVIDKRDGAA